MTSMQACRARVSRFWFHRARGASFASLLSMLLAPVTVAAEPELVPRPKSLVVAEGTLLIPPEARIVAASEELEPLARILAADVARLTGVALATARPPVRAGDILLRTRGDDPKLRGSDAHRIVVAEHAVVEGEDYGAVAFGTASIMQAVERGGAGLSLPRMTIEDDADRAFRGLQVSVRGGYHRPDWVRKVIDLMRFYKVRMLQLHTTEALWVGATLASSDGADPVMLQRHAAWSRSEMDGIVDYARQRGVRLVPHNEMRPNDPLWKAVLTEDFNAEDRFAGFVDEVDGGGPWVQPPRLADDPRFWAFVRAVTHRSYDQFARSWPGGRLPYYHIGPVYGEGGCNGQEALRMLGFLKEKNPAIRMMYWNGPGDGDPDLGPDKDNLVVDFYSAHWGGTPEGQLAAGYQVCNVSWTPLYVQPGTRIKAQRQSQWIFDEFHLARFGAEGPVGRPVEARDCRQWQDGIIGAMLATWDFAGPDQHEGHLEMVLPCLPAFAERIWTVRPWPYPAGEWERFSVAAAKLAPRVAALLRDERPPKPPGGVTATQAVHRDAIEVLWAESDNFPEHYQVFRAENDDPMQARPVSAPIPASFVTQVNRFRDATVVPEMEYFYWVRAFNPFGGSEFGRSSRGREGGPAPLPAAYEPFEYEAGVALEGLAGGRGFGTAWEVRERNAPLTVAPAGLTYDGLATSGRALLVEATDADETNRRRPPHVNVVRGLAVPYGHEGTQLWTSYLIKGLTPAIGGIQVHVGRTSVGKGWGERFTIYDASSGLKMLPDTTYLLVTRYTFHAGEDLMHLWIDPVPGVQPADTDAQVITRRFDNPEADTVTIGMQPYGRGRYLVDEIRVGGTFDEVVPAP